MSHRDYQKQPYYSRHTRRLEDAPGARSRWSITLKSLHAYLYYEVPSFLITSHLSVSAG
jgi:hypothetical protein